MILPSRLVGLRHSVFQVATVEARDDVAAMRLLVL